MVHETGHSPFGLLDEYCCDGGYWQADDLPNVYGSLAECIADIPSLRDFDATRSPADCREIRNGTTNTGWWPRSRTATT